MLWARAGDRGRARRRWIQRQYFGQSEEAASDDVGGVKETVLDRRRRTSPVIKYAATATV
jgi:hypothetical protein